MEYTEFYVYVNKQESRLRPYLTPPMIMVMMMLACPGCFARSCAPPYPTLPHPTPPNPTQPHPTHP